METIAHQIERVLLYIIDLWLDRDICIPCIELSTPRICMEASEEQVCVQHSHEDMEKHDLQICESYFNWACDQSRPQTEISR